MGREKRKEEREVRGQMADVGCPRSEVRSQQSSQGSGDHQLKENSN